MKKTCKQRNIQQALSTCTFPVHYSSEFNDHVFHLAKKYNQMCETIREPRLFYLLNVPLKLVLKTPYMIGFSALFRKKRKMKKVRRRVGRFSPRWLSQYTTNEKTNMGNVQAMLVRTRTKTISVARTCGWPLSSRYVNNFQAVKILSSTCVLHVHLISDHLSLVKKYVRTFDVSFALIF